MSLFDDCDVVPGEPSLRNIIDQEDLRWIFVGGKGGVGKTTCSCALATLMAQRRESVLILSTDPAHNVSDAFNQKFSKKASLVRGYSNLYAMEVDPSGGFEELPDELLLPPVAAGGESIFSLGKKLVKDLLTSFPGIDEAVSFAAVMKLVESMNFSVVVFDTAPTGHTLRLMAFPSVMQKGLDRVIRIRDQILPIVSQMSSVMSLDVDTTALLSKKLDETLATIKLVNEQFSDNNRTTFVCVCIPEFLSIFETERLIQELAKLKIDVHNIVVNMILPDVLLTTQCTTCEAKKKVQRSYLAQIEDLYRGFNITNLIVQPNEVRGPDNIKAFSKCLLEGDSRS